MNFLLTATKVHCVYWNSCEICDMRTHSLWLYEYGVSFCNGIFFIARQIWFESIERRNAQIIAWRSMDCAHENQTQFSKSKKLEKTYTESERERETKWNVANCRMINRIWELMKTSQRFEFRRGNNLRENLSHQNGSILLNIQSRAFGDDRHHLDASELLLIYCCAQLWPPTFRYTEYRITHSIHSTIDERASLENQTIFHNYLI